MKFLTSKTWRTVLIVLAALLLLAQLVPVEITNPPVVADANPPPAVHAILRRACYDCHSNETDWPWYSRVAPFSWFVERDVRMGRKHLNFSDWGTYNPLRETEKRFEIWEEVSAGEMPLPCYVFFHGDAELSPEDLAEIRAWALPAGRSENGD